MSDKAPNAEAIAAAESLFAIEYTPAERALMLDNIGAQIALAARRRAWPLALAVAPAQTFDPRLDRRVPAVFRRFPLMAAATPPVPRDPADIAFAPVATLSAWIRSRVLTSVALTEIYLDRIARFGGALNCIATATPELARAQARHADALLVSGTWLGPLHGIPWGCKDLFDTAGIVTGWGAEPYRDRLPQGDAAVVERLAAAGAVLVAKTSVGALAYGDIWYGGLTRNPWNTDEGSSGSSAGSAAGVAAGLFAFAIGTETLGSIVSPSDRCGVTGLRPTYGLVSRRGSMPLSWSLDKVGVLARSTADAGLVLNAIAGFDAGDPGSIETRADAALLPDVKSLRIGFYPADMAAGDELDRRALEAVGGLGVSLVPLTHGGAPYETLMSTVYAEAAATFEELTLSGEDDQLAWQDAGAWPNEFRKARFLSAVDHIQLDRLRRLVMEEMDETFRDVDLIVGPALAGPMLVITNFTGHPCLTIRAGFQERQTRGRLSIARFSIDQTASRSASAHTVPKGFSIWGRLFAESSVLVLGQALEAALGVAGRRPPIG